MIAQPIVLSSKSNVTLFSYVTRLAQLWRSRGRISAGGTAPNLGLMLIHPRPLFLQSIGKFDIVDMARQSQQYILISNEHNTSACPNASQRFSKLWRPWDWRTVVFVTLFIISLFFNITALFQRFQSASVNVAPLERTAYGMHSMSNIVYLV